MDVTALFVPMFEKALAILNSCVCRSFGVSFAVLHDVLRLEIVLYSLSSPLVITFSVSCTHKQKE